MTADEALDIVETVLDYQRLNHVQETVFRQSWEGLSYQEIAKRSGYDRDYLKDAGAKLWKRLSKAFGEKVKKDNLQSVLKRYLRRHHITLQRNEVIGVNLSGSNLSGARLLFANIDESDSCQADLYKEKEAGGTVIVQEETKAEPETNPIAQSSSETLSHFWNGWQFRSAAEANIAEALDGAGVLFFPKATARLTTNEGRQNQELYFLVCYEGKLGILAVDLEEAELEAETEPHGEVGAAQVGAASVLQSQGIRVIEHYEARECAEEPDRVVLEFLQHLSQA